MKKIIFGILAAIISTASFAEYRMIVPQAIGGGTSVWASIVAKELEKKLNEKVILEHIPGANDVPGFNKFHKELQHDPKVIMVAHGGNAESYLTQEVDYNYKQYAPIGLQNLTIIVGKRKDSDPFSGVKFAAGSGMNPDVMAITMLVCGPDKSVKQYEECFKSKVKYVKGFGGNERRLAYVRGELNVTRESTAAYFKHSAQVAENELWFSHGVLDLQTGKIADDVNFPGQNFNEVFKSKWGVYPSGEFYDAYLLVKTYRDALQKSLWVGKNNPNIEVLRKALQETIADPESIKQIEKDTGKYEWIVGDDVNKVVGKLEELTTKTALKNLVVWTSSVLGQEAFYKDSIAKTAK